MAFSDHKIAAFTHKITDLPDQPNLPADELKARFDSSPEELRQAVNGICDDAARLEARVEGIVVDTFGDTIDKEMLSDELAAELDGMADGIEALGDSLDQLDTQKCEVYFGTYTGAGYNMQVNVGFQPKAVLVIDPLTNSSSTGTVNFCGLGLQGNPVNSHILITENGFSTNRVYSDNGCLHQKGQPYIYIAFK